MQSSFWYQSGASYLGLNGTAKIPMIKEADLKKQKSQTFLVHKIKEMMIVSILNINMIMIAILIKTKSIRFSFMI